MIKLSKYTHVIPINSATFALWNSLWLRVIFVNESTLEAIRTEDPLGIHPALLQALNDNNFIADDERDQAKLMEVRRSLPHQSIGLMYLIVTEGCNFGCGYCFLKDMVCNDHAIESMMTFEIAKKAIDLFKKTIEASGVIEEPMIIFYGGEPLLNWEVIHQALIYAREQIPNISFTLNTNGSLITHEIAMVLKEMQVGVALSIDGKNHDVYRVNRGGEGTLAQVLAGLKILQEHGCAVGISCTVTDANLETLVDDFLWMIDDLGADSVDFNVLLGKEPDEHYKERATAQILKCYQIGLEKGVPVERVMRTIEPIIEGRLCLADCGGCGQQIVCAPDGQLGSCHAFLNDRSFFFQFEDVPNPDQHELWLEWKTRSPFNIPECLDCPALGVCGGGCFYNSYLRDGSVWTVDKVNCTFVTTILQTALKDMWESMQP